MIKVALLELLSLLKLCCKYERPLLAESRH